MSSPIFPSKPVQDVCRPSIFDLLAQEQLRDLFHPVVRYILSYLAQNYPRYFLRLLNHHEETFAMLLLVLERHHLKRHNASISEHFYSLRLSPSISQTPRLAKIDPRGQGKRLSRRQRWGMLFFLVGLPWGRARLQDYYEQLGGVQMPQDDDGADERGRAVTKAQRIFNMVYPYANSGVDIAFLGYDIAYLFERTNYYRPWHHLLGMKVVRAGPEDTKRNMSIFSKLPSLLPPLLLLLKLSQWWYSPNSPRTSPALTTSSTSTAAIHKNVVPPRPLPILPSSGLVTPPSTPPPGTPSPVSGITTEPDTKGLEVEANKAFEIGKENFGMCPLCKGPWQNPAILPSGWVVCWRCGWDAVEGGQSDGDEDTDDENEQDVEETSTAVVETQEAACSPSKKGGRRGRCPITGTIVAPGQLRRVLV